MARVHKDRVRESSQSYGTGDMTLEWAYVGYRRFRSVMADGDTCIYCIQPFTGPEWEIGVGTYRHPDTLERTTVIRSSNLDMRVPFSSGSVKNVFMTNCVERTALKTGDLTSGRIPYVDTTGELTDTAEVTLSSGKLQVGSSGGGGVRGGFFESDAATNTVTVGLTVGHNSSGTPAAGFGTEIRIVAESSTTTNQNVGSLASSLVDATHATLTTQTDVSAYYTSSARLGVRVKANSTAVTVGIGGVTSPTALCHMAPSTTAAASARLEAGTAPTSPNDGDQWNDSTQKSAIMYLAGIKQAFVGCIFTQTADVAVANTTTETTLVGTGIGTATLPANFWTVGKTVRLKAYGKYGTKAPATGTLLFRTKIGSTVITTTTGITPTGSLTDMYWFAEAVFTCRTTGASGTIFAQKHVLLYSAVGTIGGAAQPNAAATTVDTTASAAIAIFAKWQTADAANTLTCTNLTIEVLN